MKKNYSQQEILLVTGTTFSSRQLCKSEDTDKPEDLSQQEKLEEACWNGLLQEILPEICHSKTGLRKMYLWQIREASSFLELDLAEVPQIKDNFFSIDPYSFLKTKSAN